MPVTGDGDAELTRRAAQTMHDYGHTAAQARQKAEDDADERYHEQNVRFWLAVAVELDFLEVRDGFRAVAGDRALRIPGTGARDRLRCLADWPAE